MYRIFNKLFGWEYVFWEYVFWEYVFWEFKGLSRYGICRIKSLPSGTHYITRYWGWGFVDLNADDPRIKLTYLTCDESKYTGK